MKIQLKLFSISLDFNLQIPCIDCVLSYIPLASSCIGSNESVVFEKKT